MNKELAEAVKLLISQPLNNPLSRGQIMEVARIALPILEQQESVKKVSLREGIEAMRKSIADCGGYDFEALSEQQERGEGEWIEWKGGECPVADSTVVDLKYRDARVFEGELAGNYEWTHGYHHYLNETAADIIAYRIIPEQPTNQNGEQ